MSSAAARKAWTYADLVPIPEDMSRRYEIVAGELYVSGVPPIAHSRTVTEVLSVLSPFHQAGLGQLLPGPLDVVLSPENVLVPDLIFVARERQSILTEANIQGAPDLVVEVVWPKTRYREYGVKLNAYRRFGVRFCWIADPYSRTIDVFELQQSGEPKLLEGDDVLTCPLFPELSVRTAELFS